MAWDDDRHDEYENIGVSKQMMNYVSGHFSRLQDRLDANFAANPMSWREACTSLGGMALLIGSLAFLYQASLVPAKEYIFSLEGVHAPLREACASVQGCQKLALRMVYVRDGAFWQKQLVISGKNVRDEDVRAALLKVVEREVRSPVYRWALIDGFQPK